MSTGSYYFTIYYFTARSPSNTTLNKGIHQFFPFPYCLLRNWKLSLSFNTNLKRNLVLASPRSLLARRRVTFGTSTGHFWHVDGSLLACRRAVTILLFALCYFPQPAARPILLWIGFRYFFSFPYCFLRNLKLSLSFNTTLNRNLVLASPRSLLARRRVTFGMSTGSYYFTIYYFTARSPSNTTLNKGIHQFFPFSYCLLRNWKLSLSFITNLKRNLVLASPRSLLARGRVTFGTSTITYFLDVEGLCYFYYLLFSSPQPFHRIFHFPTILKEFWNSLSLCFNTNLKRNLVLASPRSLLARRRVTFGTSTGHFWHVDGSLLACRRAVTILLFALCYFPTRSPSNTPLKRISPIFPCSLLLPQEFETFSLFQY